MKTNCIKTILTVTTLLIFCTYGKAQLIINEIMANPNNGTLPNFEYIELYNSSDLPLQLSTFRLAVNNNQTAFPSYFLAPKQYVILCNSQAYSSFERFGNVLSLQPWLILNNNAATIRIWKDGELIDKVEYKNTWHSNAIKKNGGWSLERINPHWACDNSINWSSALTPNGGTPGRKNSVYNKSTRPKLIITSSNLLENSVLLTFNMLGSELQEWTASSFHIDQNIGSPSSIQWSSDQKELMLFFPANFKESEQYSLKFDPINICSYTITVTAEQLFRQSPLQEKDIIISEILFNPKEGGFDFVELYNTTNHAINLKSWRFGNKNITDNLLIIEPMSYLAFTINESSLATFFPSAPILQIIQVPSLPPYPNQQGNVTLYDSFNKTIDSVYYNAKMHDPLLNNVKGISLERQSVDFASKWFDLFKSSATLYEGGTPGYENSATINDLYKKNIIFLSSKTVSPNDDSFEDYLEINYEFLNPEYYLTISIYNDQGIIINRLIRNQKAGSRGKVTWDCTDDNRQKASAGFYIMIAEIYHPKGGKERFKEAFVLVPNVLYY